MRAVWRARETSGRDGKPEEREEAMVVVLEAGRFGGDGCGVEARKSFERREGEEMLDFK